MVKSSQALGPLNLSHWEKHNTRCSLENNTLDFSTNASHHCACLKDDTNGCIVSFYAVLNRSQYKIKSHCLMYIVAQILPKGQRTIFFQDESMEYIDVKNY